MLEHSKKNGIKDLMKFYKFAMNKVESEIKELLLKSELENEKNTLNSETKISSRLKTEASIEEKCRRRKIDFNDIHALTETIRDIAGVRVVSEYQDEVYEILEMIKKHYGNDLLEVEDYINNPKPSGYRSVHCIISIPIAQKAIPVEVQLRTECQEDWARFEGKTRYKGNCSKDFDELFNAYAQAVEKVDAIKTKIRISSIFN